MKSRMLRAGFTIVEITIAIVIVGILATVGTYSFLAVQKQARDGQRASDTSLIAEALEKYYEENGEYPSCEALRTSPLTALPNLDPQALVMPLSNGSNSIVCADIDSATGDVIAFVGDGSSDCSNGASCLSWTMKYKKESNGEIVVINSRRTTDIATTNGITLSGSPAGITSVTLNWNSAANATGYQIQRATDSDFTAGVTTSSHTGITTNIASLGYDTQYYFRIRPITGAGAEGNWSNVAAVRTDAIGTPVMGSTSVSGTSTTVNWGNTAYATNYQLQCSINGTTWTSCDRTTSSTSDTVSGQDQGRKYFYRVRGQNGPYSGAWSSSSQSVIAITSAPSITSISVRPVYQNTTAQPLRNIANGRCLDATGTGNGANVVIYQCHGGTNQDWTLNTSDQIVVSNSGKCLVSASGGANNGAITITTCAATANQRWTILDNGRIQNQGASGGCLEIPAGGIMNNSQSAVTNPCGNNGTSMRWYLNTVRWVWNASPCESWQTTQYQYRQRSGELGYTGSWIGSGTNNYGPWAPTSVGYVYTTDAQARCTTADATGPWGGSASSDYTLTTPMSTQPSGFYIVRHSSTIISIRGNVSCPSGSSPYSIADQYTYENPYNPPPSYGYNTWWETRGYGIDVPWGYNGPIVVATYNRVSTAVPSGTGFQMKIMVRCINPSTGRASPNTAWIVSGRVNVP